MIPPDQEIFEVEQRIALRRKQLGRHTREASRRTMQALASPVALIAAAGLGFLLAGGFSKKRKEPPHPERRKSDHTKAAKATGLVGILTPLAMWFIRAQYGSPFAMAQSFLAKYQNRSKPAPATPPRVTPAVSPRRDMARP
jgi:hypothetical protein